MKLLKFSKGRFNSKLNNLQVVLGQKIYSFNLLPGDTCKQASLCKCRVIKTPHGLQLKQYGQIRCYACSMCVRLPNLYKQCEYNLRLLRKSLKGGIRCCEKLIYQSIPRDADIIRWHVAGDFFQWKYFIAFVRTVQKFPHVCFYLHTKAIRWLVKYLSLYGRLPPNLNVSCSYGGKDDHLIPQTGLKFSKIVKDEAEAKKLGLPIDRNDSIASIGTKSFCLLLHGTQKKVCSS